MSKKDVKAKKATKVKGKEVKPAKVIVEPEVNPKPIIVKSDKEKKEILNRSFSEPKPEMENKPKMLLSIAVKTLKATVLREGGGTRKLTPEGRKSRATKALVGAMITRQWYDNLDGTYTLNQVKVDTNTSDFTVKIQDGIKDYALTLGKGAIRELDAYMKLR